MVLQVWAVNVPIPRLTYVAKDADDACVFCIIVARKKTGFKLLVYKADLRIVSNLMHIMCACYYRGVRRHNK